MEAKVGCIKLVAKTQANQSAEDVLCAQDPLNELHLLRRVLAAILAREQGGSGLRLSKGGAGAGVGAEGGWAGMGVACSWA